MERWVRLIIVEEVPAQDQSEVLVVRHDSGPARHLGVREEGLVEHRVVIGR
jgi:hypothetical protein